MRSLLGLLHGRATARTRARPQRCAFLVDPEPPSRTTRHLHGITGTMARTLPQVQNSRAYRTVQEALTNALKHSPARPPSPFTGVGRSAVQVQNGPVSSAAAQHIARLYPAAATVCAA